MCFWRGVDWILKLLDKLFLQKVNVKPAAFCKCKENHCIVFVFLYTMQPTILAIRWMYHEDCYPTYYFMERKLVLGQVNSEKKWGVSGYFCAAVVSLDQHVCGSFHFCCTPCTPKDCEGLIKNPCSSTVSSCNIKYTSCWTLRQKHILLY